MSEVNLFIGILLAFVQMSHGQEVKRVLVYCSPHFILIRNFFQLKTLKRHRTQTPCSRVSIVEYKKACSLLSTSPAFFSIQI